MSEEGETVAAPALSTYQDENTFEFQRYEKIATERPYLGPGWDIESTLVEKLRNHYSIGELVSHLSQVDDHGHVKFKKITLQFPDSLVADSSIVSQQLQAL